MMINLSDMTETDKAYLAGLLDGEGCLHISEQNRKMTPVPVYAGHVIITQGEAQADVLRKYQSELKIGSIQSNLDRGGNVVYHWRICAKAAEKFVRLVLPYLVIKTEQAKIFLEFRETFDRQGGWGTYQTPPSMLAKRKECRIKLMEAKKGSEITFSKLTTPKRETQLALL
jgi:hypothetical protein